MKAPRLLVIGRTGQVGHCLGLHLQTEAGQHMADVLHCNRSLVDLTRIDTLSSVIRDFKPDAVINAAAYTAVDKAEDEPQVADQINGHAVGVMAELCRTSGALLVHYSTDYVFEGNKNAPYVETDPVNPQNAYGRSKAMGEQFIVQTDCNAVVLRTGWVFARHGDNFYKKMLRLAGQRDSLSVVDDQTGAPTPADWLAQIGLHWVLQRAAGRDMPLGIFHAASSGKTTWHDYAALTFELAAGTPLLQRKPHLSRATSAAMNFKAKRPAWSVLSTERLRAETGLQPPDWQSCVTQSIMADIAQARDALNTQKPGH